MSFSKLIFEKVLKIPAKKLRAPIVHKLQTLDTIRHPPAYVFNPARTFRDNFCLGIFINKIVRSQNVMGN